ncbi:MAG TPA: tRNA preQ1(34) S-adenosylmethionine ribosyltransferase-isomerase QueA [Clostridiales bacterium]|nr:tRNA preQ1(34) S-adenosylmethionine ribosyltransferase-isomerase QueA [Clostridiales bacterium]
MKKSDFAYELPEHLIAQHPVPQRDCSRLMVLRSEDSQPEHRVFRELPQLLQKGDCLVLNNTKVLPARLTGCRQDSRTAVEVLLLRRLTATDWETIVRPGRRVRPGHQLEFIPGVLAAEILEVTPTGNRIVRFKFQGIWEEVLARAGTVPLPPYIHEQLEDPSRYQTVYARQEGSAAAPTAGLHFTPELLEKLCRQGIQVAELTLHVGLGTFRPVKCENILDHPMHAEYFDLPEDAVRRISECRQAGGRIVAVGTTSCRVLETVADQQGNLRACSGWTDIFIYPGYTFKAVDSLITNFHLPESTLIMLVSALAGRERILDAYAEAIRKEYRFFSFGDAMLLEKWSVQS